MVEQIREVENLKCEHPKETWFTIWGSIRVCFICHNYSKLELVDLDEQKHREKELTKKF